MPFIVWDELYETGVPAIDEQHKNLVSLANRMLDVLTKKRGKDEVLYVITQMIQYAEVHFRTEEEFMIKAGYPDLEEHILLHEGFKRKITEFEQKFETHDLSLTTELTIFLTTWVTDHFTMVDQKYVPDLKRAGLTTS